MYPHPKFATDDDGHLHLNAGDYGETIEIACFTPDGGRLLTVRELGVAQVWNVERGTLLGTIQPTSPLAHTDAGPTTAPFRVFIEAAALSPDGRAALLGLNDGTAGIFDIATGQRQCILHDPEMPPASGWSLIRAVAYTPGGDMVAVGFFGRAVGIWDARSFQIQAFLRGADPRPFIAEDGPRPSLTSSLCFSADGRLLCAGYADGAVTIWDLERQQPVLEAYEHIEAIVGLWLGDGVARWTTDGGAVWEAHVSGACKVLASGTRWLGAHFSADGTAVLATTATAFEQWDLATGAVTQTPHRFSPHRLKRALYARYGPVGPLHLLPLSAQRLLLADPAQEVELLRAEWLIPASGGPAAS